MTPDLIVTLELYEIRWQRHELSNDQNSIEPHSNSRIAILRPTERFCWCFFVCLTLKTKLMDMGNTLILPEDWYFAWYSLSSRFNVIARVIIVQEKTVFGDIN